MKVLIVEDDLLSGIVTSRPFKKNDHEVELAKNCKDALSLLASFEPDIVIIDNFLPIDDNPETKPTEEAVKLALRIRNKNGFEKIPIILMSHYKATEGLEELSKKSSITTCFEKPLDNRKLYEKAVEMVERGKGNA
jgi:CheY-like chemotaxis protein